MDGKRTVFNSHQFYAAIKNDIVAGRFKPGDKLPSIRDLAEMYDLNKSTVNAVISMLVNEGFLWVQVGKGTYVCDRRVSSVRPIGVILLDFSKPTDLDMEIIGHIQRNISPRYYLLPINAARDYGDFCVSIERLLELGAAGLIVLPPDVEPESEAQLMRAHSLLSRRPVVMINRPIQGFTADLYSMDLRDGICRACAYIAMQGKRNVALVLHNTKKFMQEELEGLYESRLKFNLTKDERHIIPFDEDLEVIRARILELLPEIDAIIAPDKLLYPLQDLFLTCGKSIPGDLSIVGINDTLHTRMFQPQMTALHYPGEKISRHAINRLIARIECPNVGQIITQQFAPELIIRGT